MVKTTPSADGPLFQAARRFHETAANTLPKGNLELRNEAYELPAALAQIADGIRIRVNVCTQSAIHPDYSTALQQIAAVIDTAANAARQLGPAFDDLHQDLVRRLLAPAPGEEKWDVANNR